MSSLRMNPELRVPFLPLKLLALVRRFVPARQLQPFLGSTHLQPVFLHDQSYSQHPELLPSFHWILALMADEALPEQLHQLQLPASQFQPVVPAR